VCLTAFAVRWRASTAARFDSQSAEVLEPTFIGLCILGCAAARSDKIATSERISINSVSCRGDKVATKVSFAQELVFNPVS